MVRKLYCTLFLLFSISYSCLGDVSFEVNGVLYSINSTGLTVDGLKDKTTPVDLKIPETITYNTRTLKVTEFAFNAFEDCTGLRSISIPASIKKFIGKADSWNSNDRYGKYNYDKCNCFKKCSNLKKVIFEDSEDELQLPAMNIDYHGSSPSYGLFSDAKIEELYIGRNLSLIYKKFNYTITKADPFSGNPIKKVTIGKYVRYLDKYLLCGLEDLEQIHIPSNVKTIESSAFYYCTGLKKVTLEEGLEEIGDNAFGGCTSLQEINLPGSLKVIGDMAFWACLELSSQIVISNNIEKIDGGCFLSCTKIKSVFIGKNVKQIMNKAFDGCYSLTEVVSFIRDPQQCNIIENAFISNTYASGILYVPQGCVDSYKRSKQWNNFFNIQEYHGSIPQELSISPIVTDEKGYIKRIYDIQGRRLEKLRKGINLILTTDGIKKIIVN